MSGQSTFQPKAFQAATIRAVLRSLNDPQGPRRFLVADEAGLGKTVVARGVIQQMVQPASRRPLVVFYVCSNQAIASQNMHQLVAFLEESERAGAMTKSDRPSLIPLYPAPMHRQLHLYPITPGTLSSSAKRGLGQGKVQERAFAYALFEIENGRPIPWLAKLLSRGTASFDEHVWRIKAYLHGQADDKGTGKFCRLFHAAMGDAFRLPKGESALESLRKIEDKVSQVTGICRNALAAAALSGLAPDLVVLDEFQRFRDLMRESSAGHDDSPLARLNARILNTVTGGIGDARLLLLSATPYEALRTQGQNKANAKDSDFYAVLDFLHFHLSDAAKRSIQVRACFDLISEQMRLGRPLSPSAVTARERLTAILRVVMCRTERERFRANASSVKGSAVIEEPLNVPDLKGFRVFARALQSDDQYWSVPLWTSVPLPLQTLGAKYVCWKNANLPARSADALTAANVETWNKPPVWPNVKVRALLKTLPTASLSMPWVRPSRPWWPLAGGWFGALGADHADGKVLVFSRFAAVPGAVAAITSFHLECELRARGRKVRSGKYAAWSKHKYVKPQASPEVFQLFFIPALLAAIDPLAAGIPPSRQAARRVIARQLTASLREKGIVVDKVTKRRPLALHRLLIAVSMHCGYWKEESAAWCAALAGSVEGPNDRSVKEVLKSWQGTLLNSMPTLTVKEFDDLVTLAMDSPAIVLARALLRHWPEALSSQASRKAPPPRHIVQSLAANSLRHYIDRPWFAAALGETTKLDYASALRRAVVDGNFESVLDEHFWLLTMTSNESWPKRISDLAASLALNGGRTLIHKPTERGKNSRIRSHVALPLHQAKTSEADTAADGKNTVDEVAEPPPRPDQVRHAFNTPFWPNVLVTTSVGQEGLDFHPWCRSIVHWDPARGPVELEQREGRVDRYAGLSIRRALGTNPACAQVADGASVWSSIRHLADRLKDAKEVSPWWQVDGARTVQFYLMTPGSREAETLKRLERGRALYRMLIGVSDPEHLLAVMASRQKISNEDAITATLRLGAWDLEQDDIPQLRKA